METSGPSLESLCRAHGSGIPGHGGLCARWAGFWQVHGQSMPGLGFCASYVGLWAPGLGFRIWGTCAQHTGSQWVHGQSMPATGFCVLGRNFWEQQEILSLALQCQDGGFGTVVHGSLLPQLRMAPSMLTLGSSARN
jgi:hypothetical protein